MKIRLLPCSRIPRVPGWAFLVLGAYGLFVLAGVALEAWLRRTVETCAFRAVTGHPCPGCGSTRALLSLARGQVAQALRFNPLVSSIVLLGLVAVGIRALTGRRLSVESSGRELRLLAGLGVIAVLANWLWVSQALR